MTKRGALVRERPTGLGSLVRLVVWGVLSVSVCLCVPGSSLAAQTDPAELRKALAGLASPDADAVEAAAERLVQQADPRLLPGLEALELDQLYADGQGQVFIRRKDRVARDALTAAPVEATGLTPVRMTNQLRRGLLPLLARLRLDAPDPATRRAAVDELIKRGAAEDAALLRVRLTKESEESIRRALEMAVAKADLGAADPKLRLEALAFLERKGDPASRADVAALARTAETGGDPDPEVRARAVSTLKAIERRQEMTRFGGHLIHGVSLASVLLLAALGLAITFGLMGVINMAHGEMLMLGAYTTYAVQVGFGKLFPSVAGLYLVAAVPLAFVVAATVGFILERSVIRFLYGRPLETLLATWGISLILIQTVRLIFGAQNVAVASPDYLAGGVNLMEGLVLPWSRIAVAVFAAVVTLAVWLILQKTPLGLQVRAISQNRPMAACLGVRTGRVDSQIFALGSGIAGLGGVALSQLGNVGPELGQTYVIDSFMIVVLGGVGRLMGTIASSLGLGMINKLLEPLSGAVMGKIVVLGIIILFIQRRPQGMFALKGRVEA